MQDQLRKGVPKGHQTKPIKNGSAKNKQTKVLTINKLQVVDQLEGKQQPERVSRIPRQSEIPVTKTENNQIEYVANRVQKSRAETRGNPPVSNQIEQLGGNLAPQPQPTHKKLSNKQKLRHKRLLVLQAEGK